MELKQSSLDAGRPPLVAVLLSFFIALAVYWRTAAPTVYTFDSAEFATGAYCLGIIHATGYPFYLLLAKLFTLVPIGDLAYRLNLMSAFWGAVTIALLTLINYRVSHRVWLSAAGALLLAFSFYYWREAVIAETYTLNTTLIALLILLLLASYDQPPLRITGLAGLILGLSFANHMSTILIVPALVYWGVVQRRKMQPLSKHLALFALGVSAGLLFYLYLPLRYAADPPLNYAKTYFDVDLTTPAGIWNWVTGEMFRAYMVGYELPDLWPEVLRYASWLMTNFLGAGVIIGLVGLIRMLRRQRQWGIFLLLVYAAYTGFFVNYRVINKDTMFSVSYMIWTVWIVSGARAIGDLVPVLKSDRSNATGARSFYRGTDSTAQPRPAAGDENPVVLAFMTLLLLIALSINYAWVDQSSHFLTTEFTGQLLRNVQPSAFIITEWTWATPLEYYQIVEKRRPDVVIFDRGLYGLAILNRMRREQLSEAAALDRVEQALAERIQAEIAHRPVYATEYDAVLARQFYFTPQDRYFRLEVRTGVDASP